jgi:hypothetical protein
MVVMVAKTAQMMCLVEGLSHVFEIQAVSNYTVQKELQQPFPVDLYRELFLVVGWAHS